MTDLNDHIALSVSLRTLPPSLRTCDYPQTTPHPQPPPLPGPTKTQECGALNISAACDVKVAFMDNSLPVRSDVDSQLILIVSFRTPVKLSALKVLGVPGEEPTVVKLWCNKKEVSFDDVDAEKPNFESEVSAAAAKGAPMALPAVRLPACTSVSLFFDAEGKDTGEGGRGGIWSEGASRPGARAPPSHPPLTPRTRSGADARNLFRPGGWRATGLDEIVGGLRTKAAPQLFKAGGRRWRRRRRLQLNQGQDGSRARKAGLALRGGGGARAIVTRGATRGGVLPRSTPPKTWHHEPTQNFWFF
jgi:hypothetical protein